MSANRSSDIRRCASVVAVACLAVVCTLFPRIAVAQPATQPSADILRLHGDVHVVADGAAIVVPLELRCSTPDTGAYLTVTQVVHGRVVSGQGGHACTANLISAQVLMIPNASYPEIGAFRGGAAFINATMGSAALHRTVTVSSADTAQSLSPGFVLPAVLTSQARGTAVQGTLRVRCSPDMYAIDATLVQVADRQVHATTVMSPCPASSGWRSVPLWFFDTYQRYPAWHAGAAVLIVGSNAFRVVTLKPGSR